ncbi:acyl-CoA dehydrogenase [Kribbella soli]|uniref:Acyl-CoA dehydrogenase n=2 Tax=Kribbella soli TaxID=1124743 RepID=A0A4V2LZ20_9ACTN|nr:acyl-CoA dehydrogenase [Kribbella soli]
MAESSSGLPDVAAAVGEALADPAVQAEYAAVRAAAAAGLAAGRPPGASEPDARSLYRELGRRRLLAPGWPEEYGGRGAGHVASAAVLEELVLAGMPDTLHVLSIQIVGSFLMAAGSPEQKQRLLPALAAGERFATVLYTEPESGSDLASLTGTARRDGDGWRLDAVKVFGLKSGQSDLALCALRTADGPSKYDGISLFLIDLDAPGVHRSNLPTLGDEQFDRVELTDVRVGAECLVGREGDGWAELNRCLPLERTGLDYSLKARAWHRVAVGGLANSEAVSDAVLAEAGRFGAMAAAGRLLTYDVLDGLDRGAGDDAAAAAAKLYTSETAQEIATWAAQLYPPGADDCLPPDAIGDLESAFREAPGLTLAAGTSQVMLEIVSSLTSGLELETGDLR